MTPHGRVYLVLFISVWVMATASVLVKLSQAPALSIAAWRLGFSVLLLAPFIAFRRPGCASAVRFRGFWLAASGVALAVHFATWILSLKLTSVAASVVLVTTHPVFVGLGSRYLLKERLTGWTTAGIALSVLGAITVGYGDFRVSGEALVGDLLAVTGALAAAAYFLIGRKVRGHVDLSAYIFIVYGIAAVLLVALALFAGAPMRGFPKATWLYLLLLAIGPQLIGHTSSNWALRHVSAAMVSVSILGEPVGASILAYFVLGERVTALTVAGGVLILGGVYVATRGEERVGREEGAV